MTQSQIAALQNPSDKDESFRTKIDERIRQLEQKLEDNIQAVEKLMQSVKRGNRKCYNCKFKFELVSLGHVSENMS